MSRRGRALEPWPVMPLKKARVAPPRSFDSQEIDEFHMLLGCLARRGTDAIIFSEEDLRSLTGNLDGVNYSVAMEQLIQAGIHECGQGGAYHIPYRNLKNWRR